MTKKNVHISQCLQKSPLYKGAYEIVQLLSFHQYTSYFVGGCVRDAFIGRPIHDIDIATTATPNQIQSLFPINKAVGAHFGVILVNLYKKSYEIATFRRDGEYKDGRHPETVFFSSEKEDALRRDFTINGLFYDPLTSTVIDYVNGVNDLQSKVITTINNPYHRFNEDKLRILRCIRFYAQLHPFKFEINPEIFPVIKEMAETIRQVTKERIKEEIYRILIVADDISPLLYLEDLGLTNFIFPHSPKKINYSLFLELKKHSQISCELLLLSLFWEIPHIISLLTGLFILSNKEKEILQSTLSFIETIKIIDKLKLFEIKRLLRTPNMELILIFIKEWQKIFDPFNAKNIVLLIESFNQYKNNLYPPLFITGDTLIKKGIKPSPLFKNILTQLENEQLDENIHSLQEALNYLNNLLKKEGCFY